MKSASLILLLWSSCAWCDARTFVDFSHFADMPSTLQRLTLTTGTAFVLGHNGRSETGTAFFVGFAGGTPQGEALLATNYHVFENEFQCAQTIVTFYDSSGNQHETDCKRILVALNPATTREDFVLFSVGKLSARLASQFQKNAFSLDTNGTSDQADLSTLGYGIDDNSFNGWSMRPRYETGGNCMRIPLENSYPMGRHSEQTGCHTSPGDSGSPVIDNGTDKIVAVVWGSSGATSYALPMAELIGSVGLAVDDPTSAVRSADRKLLQKFFGASLKNDEKFAPVNGSPPVEDQGPTTP